MKNYNIPQWKYELGKVHVSIGCADFQQLLMGRVVGNSENALNFFGVDCALVSITRCHILNQMMKNKCASRNILQVWFSTAWSNDALKDFKKSSEDLLLNDTIEDEIKELLEKCQ